MTRIVHHPAELPERVSGLEASLSALQGEVQTIQTTVTEGFRDIKGSLDNSTRTNWGVILSGVIVLLSLYAAAVAPISADLRRQELLASRLADAVVKQNESLTDLGIKSAITDAETRTMKAEMAHIRDEGAPITDRRLTVIEFALKQRDVTGLNLK